MVEECKPILNTGLRGQVIASSKISDVRGREGKLIYRGYLIQDLADKVSYEETIHLLIYEKLPDRKELEDFKTKLKVERSIPEEVIAALKTRPYNALPMDVLQAGVALLAHHDPDIRDQSREASEKMAIRLIAKLPTILGAWERIRNGKEVVYPREDLDHAANFLYMLHGQVPDDEVAKFLDTCLVLHAEHSFNASTFAAREVASTKAHMYASIAAGVGSLSGDLHGGANVRVMQMLQDIGSVEKVEAFVKKALSEGKKIMGLGHAVYQVDDPRAFILAPMSKRMGERMGETKWYEISRHLEKTAKKIFKEKKGIDLPVNVDFYSASLYYSMGIPEDFFSPVFAISRVAGWAAHVLEEQFAEAAPKPTLYRPESKYVGEYCGPEQCEFVPVDKR
ncbi:MAG: citrate/2-methylcitrate synthase [Desulfobacterales bacterium]